MKDELIDPLSADRYITITDMIKVMISK
jgi:hypothetical protein